MSERQVTHVLELEKSCLFESNCPERLGCRSAGKGKQEATQMADNQTSEDRNISLQRQEQGQQSTSTGVQNTQAEGLSAGEASATGGNTVQRLRAEQNANTDCATTDELCRSSAFQGQLVSDAGLTRRHNVFLSRLYLHFLTPQQNGYFPHTLDVSSLPSDQVLIRLLQTEYKQHCSSKGRIMNQSKSLKFRRVSVLSDYTCLALI